MKKQVISSLLCVILLLCACRPESTAQSHPSCFFFYPAKESTQSVLLSAPVALEPEQLSPQDFFTQYLQAPTPDDADPLLPTGWRLKSFSMEGTAAQLHFTGIKVSMIRRSLALSCLTKTLLQHPQIRSVSVLSPESDNPTVLTENDMLFKDTGMLPQQEQVTLYFPDAARRYLISETRSVDPSQASDKPTFILQQLLSEENGNCIPAGTKLLSVSVENGVCTIDLSSEFEQDMEQSFASERMAVYSIVNSLTELPEISTVDIWVAGAPLEALRFLNLSQGISRDEGLFFASMTANYADVAIYPSCGTEGLLAEIPLMLETADKHELAEQVVQALISFDGKNGLKNCVPQGTKLLSVRIENSTCVLDFTGEFLAGCHNEAEEILAVHSVIASVCSIDGISSVEILVEGIEPNFRIDTLRHLRRVQKEWIAP